MTPLPPVAGWKLASWGRHSDGSVFFTGLVGGAYEPDAVSRCRYGCPPGEPRTDAHRCGFYAWRDRKRGFTPDARRVELQVLLGGRVREYRHGYRAGRQRVLAVHLPPVCRWCEALAGGLHEPTFAPACDRCLRLRDSAPYPLEAARSDTGLAVWWLSTALLNR